MESEILKYAVDGGVGLVAIIVVFLFYRADALRRDKAAREDTQKRDQMWAEHCLELKEILKDKRELIKADQQTREENIKVLTGLTELLRGLNGKVAKILSMGIDK